MRSPMTTLPRVITRPATMRSAVVFPQPDGPTSTMNSPSTMSRLSADRLRPVREHLPDIFEKDLCHVRTVPLYERGGAVVDRSTSSSA